MKAASQARFWSKVDKTDGGCWLWTGAPDPGGYGRFSDRGNSLYAHRVAYELLLGPIPDGLHIDHLCRVRHCVNPGHMEPVTRTENTRRGVLSARFEPLPEFRKLAYSRLRDAGVRRRRAAELAQMSTKTGGRIDAAEGRCGTCGRPRPVVPNHQETQR